MGVNWENFSNTKKMRRERLSAAIKMIILAGFAWSVCIYLPYAWYASSFSYSNGDKPSGLMTVSLTVTQLPSVFLFVVFFFFFF